jgi:hypothetical protein
MTQDQIILFGWLASLVLRIPRIVERWKAPFLNGPGWFFGVEVPADFLAGGGRQILTKYRLRLFLPWAVEIPISAALFVTGHYAAILLLAAVITLLTRLNYYADRKAAEDAAREFEVPRATKPVVTLALSLQPRTLRAYTNWWIEAPIAIALSGSLVWLVYRYATLGDWHLLRGPLAVTLMSIYLQFGMLLMKRGFIRARSVAPAENAEQYLTWRESLRRLSTTICDYLRLLLVFFPLLVDLASVTDRWQDSVQRRISMIFFLVLFVPILWREWWIRSQHLKVVRATKPAGFLVLPDAADPARLVCFEPSLPMLLLKTSKGYALNLASAPAKTAGLYLAGCAVLWVCLTR